LTIDDLRFAISDPRFVLCALCFRPCLPGSSPVVPPHWFVVELTTGEGPIGYLMEYEQDEE
jgi:hypothetical protein